MTDKPISTIPSEFLDLQAAHERAAAWALNNAIIVAGMAYRETFARAFANCYRELIADEMKSA